MPGKIIQVENLKVTFKTQGGDIEAVRGISFDIDQSENVAIVGESGSGKTTISLATSSTAASWAKEGSCPGIGARNCGRVV